MLKRLITLFSIVFLLCSCTTYEISEGDLEWQPYNEGDILIFESSKDEQDTIVVKSVEVYTNPEDPLALFGSEVQSLFVFGGRSILEIESGEKDCYIQFTIRLGESYLRYPNVIVTINDLDKMVLDSNNRYVIEAKEFYDDINDRSFDLKYIFWSKNYGYLGLEFNNNYKWSLKSFIRNGRELL